MVCAPVTPRVVCWLMSSLTMTCILAWCENWISAADRDCAGISKSTCRSRSTARAVSEKRQPRTARKVRTMKFPCHCCDRFAPITSEELFSELSLPLDEHDITVRGAVGPHRVGLFDGFHPIADGRGEDSTCEMQRRDRRLLDEDFVLRIPVQVLDNRAQRLPDIRQLATAPLQGARGIDAGDHCRATVTRIGELISGFRPPGRGKADFCKSTACDFDGAFLDRHGDPVRLAPDIEGRSNCGNADIPRMHDEGMASVVLDLEVRLAGRQVQVAPRAVEVDIERCLGTQDDPGAVRQRGCPVGLRRCDLLAGDRESALTRE